MPLAPIDDSLIVDNIRRFFPVGIQEAAIQNLQLRLENAYTQGKVDLLRETGRDKDTDTAGNRACEG